MEFKERIFKEKAKSERLEINEQLQPKQAIVSVCSLCGKLATQLVDGEPCCEDHVEQIYEHQVEDYTRKHLNDHS